MEKCETVSHSSGVVSLSGVPAFSLPNERLQSPRQVVFGVAVVAALVFDANDILMEAGSDFLGSFKNDLWSFGGQADKPHRLGNSFKISFAGNDGK